MGYDEELESETDALAALQAAEVERRLRYPDAFPHARRSAFLDGFSLYAGVRTKAALRSQGPLVSLSPARDARGRGVG